MRIDWSFVKGSAVVGVGNVVAHVLGFVFFVIVARMYVPSEYGYIRYVITIATLACAVASTGFPSASTIYVSRYSKDEELRDVYFSNSLIAIFILFLATILVLFVMGKLDLGTLLVMIGLTVAATYLGTIRGFILCRRIAGFQISTNSLKIALVALLFYVVGFCPSLYVLAIFGFACLIPICIIEIIRPLPLRFRRKSISKNVLKELTKFAVPVIISSVTYSMIMSIDIICIKYFLGLEQVGFYSVARTLVVVFTFVPMSINTLLMPKVARLRERKRVFEYLKISVTAVALVSTGLFLGFYAFGEMVIRMVFGTEYLYATSALSILSLGMILFSISSIADNVWMGIGKPMLPTKIILVAMGINVVGNICLIPRMGTFGAGLSFTLSYLAVAVIWLAIFLKERKDGFPSFS